MKLGGLVALAKKKIKEQKQQADLRIVEKEEVLTKPYNDINLKKWKEYPHVLTDTLWEFKSREKNNGHSYD